MHRWFRKCAGQTTFRRTGDAARLRFEQLEDRRLLTVASFQDGVFPTVDYDGTRDAPIFGAQADVNFGGDDIIRADSEQSSTGFPVWSLMKWDLSSIPAGATLNDVMLTVNVTNTTAAPGFDLFQVLTPWEESGVTWNNSTAVATWEEPGVSDPADLDPTVLGTLLGTTTGELTISLNADGLDVVQEWISNPATNHGLLMANPANGNSLRFDSREGATPTNRPKLSVDFTFEDLDPPVATLVDPLDGGPADEDADANEVRVGVRNTIVIGLDDFELDDATVIADTLTVVKDAAPFTDYTFAFDAVADQITLTATAGSFSEGVYTVTLSGGVSKIADLSGHIMPGVELLVEIDASLPTMPVAEDDTYETDEGVPLNINAASGVLENDFNGNAAAEAIIVTSPVSGNLGLNLDGSFIYTPSAGFSDQDSFTYLLRTSVFDSNVATVTINVQDNSPITADDSYNATEDELLTVDEAAGVLSNDEDLQDDEITAVLVDNVGNGTLSLNADGSFTYQPDENDFGIDSFTYYATDGVNNSASTLVEIAVENVNDAPQATNDDYTYLPLQSTGTTILPYLSQGFRYLVSNAAVPITDFEQPDFDDSAFLVGDAPFGYTPTMPPGNTVWPLSQDLNIRKEFWVPAGVTALEVGLAIDDYAQVFVNGVDVSNGLQPGLSVAEYDDLVFDIPMHLINPGAANLLAIWAVDHGVVAYFDVEVRATVVDSTGALIIPEPFGVLVNDLDVDGGELSALLVQDVENGTLELRDDGSFTYTPDARFVGVDRFTYVASDSVDSSIPATVTINIPPSGPIAGRHVFYNNSSLDGQEPAAEAQDDNAIATKKWVLLPGQTLSPGKVFAGTQGINGLMIDIDGVGDAVNLGADDFVVRTGTGGDPSGWDVLEQVESERVPVVTVREGDGVGGSDRVTLTWPDGTLTNTYVEVTVLANARTGLATPDIFYAASRVGDATGDRKVDAADLARVLANWGTGTLPEQGNFDLTGITGAADLAALFVGGSPLDEFTAPIINLIPTAVDDTYRYEAGILGPVGNVYADTILDDGPIGYWRLGGTASVTAEDAVGNHDGVYANFVSGDFLHPGALALDTDRSVMFDGVDNQVMVPHSPDLAITGDLTIEFWMYKTSEAPGWQRLVGKGSDNIRTFGVWEADYGKALMFNQRNGSNGTAVTILSNSTVELDQWYHVVATVEGNAAKLFIDGTLDAQNTRAGVPGIDTQPLTFGRMPGRYDHFPGQLDEIAIYDYALTDEEIEEHFRLGNTGVGTVPRSVLANDVDFEGGPLTAQLVDDVQHGTLDLSADGNFSYVPDPGFVGTDQFTYVAFDGENESVPTTVTIEVVPPADAAQAVDVVIVQAIGGPEPETDLIIGPVEFPAEITSQENGRRLLRRMGRSFSHDAEPTDRQRLARQQAIDRVHEAGSLELPDESRIVRRRGGRR